MVFHSPPYATDINKAGIDYTLAAAVFEQNLSCLFMGKGILQLLANQNPDSIKQKSTEKMLNAFEMYDIENIYIDEDALNEYQISTEQLCLNGKIIGNQAIQQLMQQHAFIFKF